MTPLKKGQDTPNANLTPTTSGLHALSGPYIW
jgi:hypothetical protein